MSSATPTRINLPERPDPADTTARSPGSLLASAGALGTAVALLVTVLADPGGLPFVAPPAIIALVVAALAWRFGTWSRVLAAVWGVFALAQLPMTPMLEGLSRPDSLFDFVPGWVFTLSAITAIVGGVLGVTRRHEPGPGRVERPWLAAVGAIGAFLVAISGIASITSDSALTDAERAGAIEVSMTDGTFTPETLQLSPGEVQLALRNDGNVLHTFTVDELGIDETLSPGQERLVSATVGDGTSGFVFYCRPHSEVTDDGRDGMTGRVAIG